MRGTRRWIGILLILLLLPASTFAAEKYYGTVVCEITSSVLAPFGGVVTGLSVRAGQLIRTGDPICTIQTKPVYSPVAGTVSSVFGEPGDNTEDVKNWRGGVIYIIPANRYTVSASSKEASKGPDNYMSVGQTVYLAKGKGKFMKPGTGIIVSILTEAPDPEQAGGYSVEITSGDFTIGDTIYIYSTEARDRPAYLGNGTVRQTAQVIVSGDGSILKMHVQPGDTVERGTLLYETVAGALADMKGGDNQILATADGIVSSVETINGATVEQNNTLINLYPLDTLRVCITVSETELARFPAGQKVKVTFGTDTVTEGTVESVKYLAETSESAGSAVGYANYKVFIDFEGKENVREGLLATVEFP